MAVRRKPKPRLNTRSSGTTTRKKKPSASKIESSGKGKRKSQIAGTYGADGFDAAREQQERQKAAYERRKEMPFEFRITSKQIENGENEVELLYLDEVPLFVRLHDVQTPNGGFGKEICLAGTGDNCPLCRMLGKEGTHTLVLTALDKRPYRNREGKLIKTSRKLVLVKSRNIPKFERQYKKHGTFRGLVCTHIRDAAGNKEAAIGESLEFREKLVSDKILRKYGDMAKVPDYSKIYAAPTPEQLESQYGYLAKGGSGGGGGNYGSGGSRGATEEDDGEVAW